MVGNNGQEGHVEEEAVAEVLVDSWAHLDHYNKQFAKLAIPDETVMAVAVVVIAGSLNYSSS